MALTIDSKAPIDIEFYEYKMNQNCYVLVDKEKFEKRATELSSIQDSLENDCKNKMQIYGNRSMLGVKVSNDQFLDLLEELGVPVKKLCRYDSTTRSYSRSASRSDVIEPLIKDIESGNFNCGENTEAVMDLLTTFSEYRKAKSDSSVKPKIMRMIKGDGESDDGSKDIGIDGQQLYRIYYELYRRSTNRYYTSKDNVQGYNIMYVKSFTVRKDRYIVSIDFSQIDLRGAINIFLKNADNRAIFEDDVTDKYRSLTKAMCAQSKRDFNEVEYQNERAIFKKIALSVLYLSSHVQAGEGSVQESVSQRLRTFYNACSRYSNYLKLAEILISNDIQTDIRDYFGYIRSIQPSEVDNPIGKFINSPVQMTSAMIMPIVINAIYDKFMELGYKDGDVNYYINRHDEMVFDMSMDTFKDIWVFNDYSRVYIDDWDELRLDVEVYRYYKEDDKYHKEYMQKYNDICNEKLGPNNENETPVNPTTRKVLSYCPIGKVYVVYNFPTFERAMKIQLMNSNYLDNNTELWKGMTRDEACVALATNESVIKDMYSIYTDLEETMNKVKKFEGYTYVVDLNNDTAFRTKKKININKLVSAHTTQCLFYAGQFDYEKPNCITKIRAIMSSDYDVAENLDGMISNDDKRYMVNTSFAKGEAKVKWR